MSRYEDPEGTGEYPAGEQGRGLWRRRGGATDDPGGWDAGASSRRSQQSDPWQPYARSAAAVPQSPALLPGGVLASALRVLVAAHCCCSALLGTNPS